MRGKEASSDRSAEGLRLPGAGMGTPPLRSRRFPADIRARAAKTRRWPRRLPRGLRGGGEGTGRAPFAFSGGEGGRLPGEVPGGAIAAAGPGAGPGVRASCERGSV